MLSESSENKRGHKWAKSLGRGHASEQSRHGIGVPGNIRLAGFILLLALQERFVEAESLYRRSLKINQTTQGQVHHSVATDLRNLAKLLQRQVLLIIPMLF